MDDSDSAADSPAIIVWSERFATGLETIDGQHRQLIALYNDLVASLLSSDSTVPTLRTLARLADYARDHFQAEETLMRRSGFPGYADHKRAHDDFVRVLHVLSRRRPNDPTTLRDIARFLHGWIIHHVLDCDGELRALADADLPGEEAVTPGLPPPVTVPAERRPSRGAQS